MAVVHAVSETLSRDPCAVQPLAEVLDPDALDSLFNPQDDGTERLGGNLTFVYSDCHVSIQNGEFISVDPLDADVNLTDSSGVDRST